ncbi:hypothetical protein V6N11_017776 [Hibiscus sabdariffa]|uniref:Uncharacterized protein n=1 Tax=Hibiscus sabdariffa TaxID=183260 RepID=A0ABR2TZK2_9ROSI
MLTCDNPSDRALEEGISVRVAPTLERLASPTPLEGKNSAKKDRVTRHLWRANPIVDFGNGKGEQLVEPHGSGKATYSSVVDKSLGSLDSKATDNRYVEEEVVVLEDDVIFLSV